jgi:hypothetical protein
MSSFMVNIEILPFVMVAGVFLTLHISSSYWFISGAAKRSVFFDHAEQYLKDDSISDDERYLVESMIDDVENSSFLWRVAALLPFKALVVKLDPPTYQPMIASQHKASFSGLLEAHFSAVIHTGTYSFLFLLFTSTLAFLILTLRGEMMRYLYIWTIVVEESTPKSDAWGDGGSGPKGRRSTDRAAFAKAA